VAVYASLHYNIDALPCQPRNRQGLTDEQLELLKEKLGLDVKSVADVELDVSWQHMSIADLKKLPNKQLKNI
jgi:hypothetical protein